MKKDKEVEIILEYEKAAYQKLVQKYDNEMRTKPQFIRVTSAGMSESHVHDVSITKEAPNYPVR